MDNKRILAGLIDFIISAGIQALLMFLFIFLPILTNENNGNSAAAKARLLRNITWFLGPVELFAMFLFGYRIGDKIAKTEVIAEKKPPCSDSYQNFPLYPVPTLRRSFVASSREVLSFISYTIPDIPPRTSRRRVSATARSSASAGLRPLLRGEGRQYRLRP